MSSLFWDEIYAKESPFGDGPIQIVQKALLYQRGGRALDLGAGYGRHAIFLAQNGFAVDAIEYSSVGAQRMRSAALERQLPLTVFEQDVHQFQPAHEYELVVNAYVLHELSRVDGLEVVAKMQQLTVLGGLNVITSFTQSGDFFEEYPETEKLYFKQDELRALYADWEILSYEEMRRQAMVKKPDGTRKHNIVAMLLARKKF